MYLAIIPIIIANIMVVHASDWPWHEWRWHLTSKQLAKYRISSSIRWTPNSFTVNAVSKHMIEMQIKAQINRVGLYTICIQTVPHEWECNPHWKDIRIIGEIEWQIQEFTADNEHGLRLRIIGKTNSGIISGFVVGVENQRNIRSKNYEVVDLNDHLWNVGKIWKIIGAVLILSLLGCCVFCCYLACRKTAPKQQIVVQPNQAIVNV
eukprot:226359_1